MFEVFRSSRQLVRQSGNRGRLVRLCLLSLVVECVFSVFAEEECPFQGRLWQLLPTKEKLANADE